MTREQQLKVLKSRKSSKEELREALAASLDVDYQPIDKAQKLPPSVSTQCITFFTEAYKEATGLPYQFEAKDGVAIHFIIRKINSLLKIEESNENTVLTFRALIEKLPDWYRANAFSLPQINSAFNTIVANIKTSTTNGITDDYEASIIRDLTT